MSDVQLVIADPGLAADEMLARRCLEVLDRHYSGHKWGVEAKSEQGVVIVRNYDLSGRWGFLLKLHGFNGLYMDPNLDSVMRAGGELLERYRVIRGRYKPENYSHLPKMVSYSSRAKPPE